MADGRENGMTTFSYDEILKEVGIAKVVIEYSGSDDEGYINDITVESLDGASVDLELGNELYDLIRDEAYDLLSSESPGWEINEGSQGHITILVAERKAFLHHGLNEIRTDYYDKEFS